MRGLLALHDPQAPLREHGHLRPHTMTLTRTLVVGFLLATFAASRAEEVPQTVEQLWADFDPRRDALETEVIREFKEDGGVVRHVRFVVGTFKGKTARMTAIYEFPDKAKDKTEKLPAVMHIHGGGQCAFLSQVKLLVSRG